MKVRIRFTAGLHATPWKEVTIGGDKINRALFERTEFRPREDIPTDFIVEVQPANIAPQKGSMTYVETNGDGPG